MATTYTIAAIGDWNSVMGFRALGLDTYPVSSPDEAREEIKRLAKTDCAVIYLTEPLARSMDDVLERYKDELRPTIILIPGREGSAGLGLQAQHVAVARAVGTNILRA